MPIAGRAVRVKRYYSFSKGSIANTSCQPHDKSGLDVASGEFVLSGAPFAWKRKATDGFGSWNGTADLSREIQPITNEASLTHIQEIIEVELV
jgi:hypothetical protein